MEYAKFDPGARRLPKPKVSALPTLGLRSLKPGASAIKGLMRTPGIRFYSRSRYALTDAYRLSGVGANTALLAPAYHCRTMLDPAIALGAEIALYPLLPDLAPDLDGLMSCIAGSRNRIAALLVTHYFGFPQPLEALLAICKEHDIALIEDCSHCLIAQPESSKLGRQGIYSVWSPYKFFPCEDGGVLWANRNAALPVDKARTPSIRQELKGWARVLQRITAGGSSLDANTLEADIDNLPDTSSAVSDDILQSSNAPSEQYDAAFEGEESLAGSRWIMRHTNVERVTELRRKNYLQWTRSVSGLPHCHALFPTLPVGCAPYMFPLVVEHPEVHFIALKYLGFTEWRWDNMAVSSCAVAMSYRLKLLQLPCHQELTSGQMAWMTSAMAKVLTRLPTRSIRDATTQSIKS